MIEKCCDTLFYLFKTSGKNTNHIKSWKTVLCMKHDHFKNRQITKFIFPYWSITYDTTDLNQIYAVKINVVFCLWLSRK